MSLTMVVSGDFNFSDKDKFEKCLKELKENNWINDEGGICLSYPNFSCEAVDYEGMRIEIHSEYIENFWSFREICQKYTNDINFTYVYADRFGKDRAAGVYRRNKEVKSDSLINWAQKQSTFNFLILAKAASEDERTAEAIDELTDLYLYTEGEAA